MRIAIPEWNGRISPVFDVAGSIRVFEIHEGMVTEVSRRRFKGDSQAAELVKLGVNLVICAAISTSLESTLWVSGIDVIPDTCGAVPDIVASFAAGDTELKTFRSPGIRHGRRPSTMIHSRRRVEARHRR